MKKIDEQVRQILVICPELRERKKTKEFIWKYWKSESEGMENILTYNEYMKCANPGSITRSKRKVQKLHPTLRGKDYKQKDELEYKWQGDLGYYK